MGSKVRTTLYSIINSTTGKYCSIAFMKWSHLMISFRDSNFEEEKCSLKWGFTCACHSGMKRELKYIVLNIKYMVLML